jgi:histidine triad (HIT) family protein
MLDIAPVNPGHVLVLTKRCFHNIEDIDEVQLAYVMKQVKRIGAALKALPGVEAYNVIINNGSAAGQLINHFHCHIIPRHNGDGLRAWPQKSYPDDEATKLANTLKKALV